MKPQLVVQDFAGVHGADLERTRSRLIKGGSWKKQRVIVILPASDKIWSVVHLAQWNLIWPPNQAIYKVLGLGMEVGKAYSSTIEQILANEELSQFEYILTIEHDNAPPPDGLLKLLERMEEHPELSCISGLYFTKGEGGVAQIWGDVKDPLPNYRPQVPVTGQLIECYGTGMGFALFRLKMFKDSRLRKPWFATQANKDGVGTQDLYFWSDARKYGYKCAVDCSVKVGHFDGEVMW